MARKSRPTVKPQNPAEAPKAEGPKEAAAVLQQDPGPMMITVGLNVVTQKVTFSMTHADRNALRVFLGLLSAVQPQLQARLEAMAEAEGKSTNAAG